MPRERWLDAICPDHGVRAIRRHNGDAGVRNVNCAWLFHMGLKNVPAPSTLADALNLRDSHTHHSRPGDARDHARHSLHDNERLNPTTIDLCLTLFDGPPFRSTKAAFELYTMLELRRTIPAFIHISDCKMPEVNVLDFPPFEAGAFYVMDRSCLDFVWLFKLRRSHLGLQVIVFRHSTYQRSPGNGTFSAMPLGVSR